MKTTWYKLNIVRPDLAAGDMRIAFLTDLHNAENGPGNQKLIETVKEASPDLILCGGDMIVGRENIPFQTAQDLMLKLSEDFPIYHALGNHESRVKQYPHQYGPMYEEYVKPLKKAGITFLDNESVLLAVKGIPLYLSGCTLPKKYYKRTGHYKLQPSEMYTLVGRPDPLALNILLAHHPKHMKTYKDWGADLTLCGHYHGGILKIGRHTGLVTPSLHVFDRHSCGQFDFHKRSVNGAVVAAESHVIVGAGLGEHTLPMRIHNPRELVIIDLHITKE